jgi:hypothetical protein
VALAILAVILGVLANVSSADTWHKEAGFHWAELKVPETGQTGFTLLTPEQSGIYFTNYVPEQRHLTNQILLDGSGVAAGDVDGDGLPDLFFCHEGGPSALFRNLGGGKFQDITEAAGVACNGLNVTGAALADLDGDGHLDLIVNALGGGTHIFLNDGHGHFKEMALDLNHGKAATSLAVGDVDGDGYLDLYVANYRPSGLMDIPNAYATVKRVNGKLVMDRLDGRPTTEPDLTNRFVVTPEHGVQEIGQPDVLFHNASGTNFVAVSFTGGAFLDEDGKPLTEPPYDWGLSVMFRDINGDGLPDLYVCNDFQTPDRIWINQGKGVFRAAPRLALRHTSHFSMGVDFADINHDGLDDFLVLDMLSRDHRQRLSQMMDRPVLVPAIGDLESRPQYGRNTLFLNRGDGTFAEIAELSGLDATEWSWTPIFLDVDLDGWEDVVIATGQERAGRDADVIEQLKSLRAAQRRTDLEIFQARKIFPRLATGVRAFRNQRDLTFAEKTVDWGLGAAELSHGMCLCDIDGDGDLDLIVNNMNSAAQIYRNDCAAPRVAVRLNGLPPNTRGIGAKIWLFGGAVPEQNQEMICGGRYLSSDDPMRVFAAGSRANEMRLEVRWRSGKHSVINGVRANRIYEIDEAGAAMAPEERSVGTVERSEPQSSPKRRDSTNSDIAAGKNARAPGERKSSAAGTNTPLFEDVSRLLAHSHHQEAYNDFELQPLLQRKLSQLGPGVAWVDADGDGHEDLIIGTGRGGRMAIYKNDGRGGFKLMTNVWATGVSDRNQGGIVALAGAGKPGVILAGAGNYETGGTAASRVQQFDLASRTVDESLTISGSSIGPLALADLSGDGELALFIGGRVIAGRYPEPAGSCIYRHRQGRWEMDEQNKEVLDKVGLVSGAVWSDLDGDGCPQLILACDCGPIKIFHNERGRLSPWNPAITWPAGELRSLNSQPSTLNQLVGLWTGVSTGDLDGDGRLDMVVGNWGRNTRYESHRSQPLRVYYGDFDGNGITELIEAYYDPQMNKIVPEDGLDFIAAGMPQVRARFSTHHAFAEAGIDQVLGDWVQKATEVQLTALESMVLLNRGDHFEAHALPVEAQFAPVFGVCVADADGDGNEDVFLSQNFFDVRPEAARLDAGRGLWLRGNGQGGLHAMPGQESGVKIYGEQRGAALCDFDGDGRVDLVVAQNGAETKLYHNVGARAGLRVRLQGPPGNPQGIGAVMRLRFDDHDGPAREVHAGSGYWSQDSATQVLATPAPPGAIIVRWPGGAVTTNSIPAGAKEISVANQ